MSSADGHGGPSHACVLLPHGGWLAAEDFDASAPRPRLLSVMTGASASNERALHEGGIDYLVADLPPATVCALLEAMNQTAALGRQEGRKVFNSGPGRDVEGGLPGGQLALRGPLSDVDDPLATRLQDLLEDSWDDERILAAGTDISLPGETFAGSRDGWAVACWPDCLELRWSAPRDRPDLGTLASFALHRQTLYWYLLFSVRMGARERLFRALMETDIAFALDVLEAGGPRPDLGRAPRPTFTSTLDEDLFGELLGHDDPAVRRRAMQAAEHITPPDHMTR